MPRSVVGVEPLCEIPPERSVPKLADIQPVGACKSFGQLPVSFGQFRLCRQSTTLPVLLMLINLTRKALQSLNLLHHLLVVDEIPLMEIVDVIQEELHVACLIGQNQATLLFCDSIATPKVLKSPVCNRIVFNITQCKRHGWPRYANNRSQFFWKSRQEKGPLSFMHTSVPFQLRNWRKRPV